MEFNRNHYFLVGIVVLLLGIQLRIVDSFVLNESSTRLMAAQSSTGGGKPLLLAVGQPHKVIRPPEWLGWSLMSIGSVLILHSLAMKGPGAEPH